MFRKILTTICCTLIISIGGLFFTSDLIAQENYSCINFNIELIGVNRAYGDVFQYKYIITGGGIAINKISLVEFGVEEALSVTPTENVKVFSPGVGGLGSDDWLSGVPQLQVLNITAQSYTEANPLIIEVSGTGGNIGTVAAHSQAGNKLETCFIQGPLVGLPVDVSIPSSKKVNLNGIDYCIDINPRTGCPDPNPSVYNCLTGEQLQLDVQFVLGSYDPADGTPAPPTMVHGEGSDPRCPIAKAAHNPCQWVLLGGRAYGPVCW